MKTQHYLLIGLTTVIVAVIGFYAGMKYQQNQRSTFNRDVNNPNSRQFIGQNGQRPNGGNFRPVNGEVIATDADSFTVKLPDESSKIVVISDQTPVSVSQPVSVGEITIGDRIMVLGTENSDGSLTAQNVQLNPPEAGWRTESLKQTESDRP